MLCIKIIRRCARPKAVASCHLLGNVIRPQRDAREPGGGGWTEDEWRIGLAIMGVKAHPDDRAEPTAEIPRGKFYA